jgi:hypothetical protein
MPEMDYSVLNAISDARKGQVVTPEKAVLTYSVCGPDDGACGWEGWLLEGTAIRRPSSKGPDIDVFLPTADLQICPNCKKTLYRTDSRFTFYFGEALEN